MQKKKIYHGDTEDTEQNPEKNKEWKQGKGAGKYGAGGFALFRGILCALRASVVSSLGPGFYACIRKKAKAVASSPATRNWGTLVMRKRAVRLSTRPTAQARRPMPRK